MNMSYRGLALLIITCTQAVPCFGQTGLADAQRAIKLEQECLKYRQENTSSGFVHLEITRTEAGQPPVQFDLRILFSDKQLRFDSKQKIADGDWSGRTITVVDEEKYIRISGDKKFSGTVGFNSDYGDPLSYFSLFHPRWLGMGVNDEAFLHQAPNGRAVGNTTNKTPVVISRVPDVEPETWEIAHFQSMAIGDARKLQMQPERPKSYGLDDSTESETKVVPPTSPQIPEGYSDADTIDNTTKTWIVPNQGHSLLLAAVIHKSPGTDLMQTMECSVKSYGRKGVWYPSKVERRMTLNDELMKEEIIIVKEADFDMPMKKEYFSLEGLDLVDGREVYDRTRGKLERKLLVDGEDVTEVLQIAEVDPELWSNRRILLAINGLVLAVLATLYVRRIYGKKRQN